MAWLPAWVSARVVRLATPLEMLALPKYTEPSKKFTVPVPLPTFADSTTGLPATMLADETPISTPEEMAMDIGLETPLTAAPVYTAETFAMPTLRKPLVVSVAMPLAMLPVPRNAVPLKKSTRPEGDAPVTVAVKVTAAPAAICALDAPSATVAGTAVTCRSCAAEAVAALRASPEYCTVMAFDPESSASVPSEAVPCESVAVPSTTPFA
ncbi:hypothetical protein ACAN107058_14670 [Paracidovorax anthurii]